YERGARQVFRLRTTARSGAASPIRRGGTYLVTGGMGGLGWLIASWLVERHAANVVLTGRAEPDAETARRLAELTRSGAQATYAQADVSDLAAMQRAIERAEREIGPLRGVFHAAGVPPDDRDFRAATAAAFDRVTAAKITGTLVIE